MFHDPLLGESASKRAVPLVLSAFGQRRKPVLILTESPKTDRTTDGSGSIHDQKYHGEVDQLRTRKAPHQKIPTLQETLDLLMEPENQHVMLNIDIKVNNDPERLFTIMSQLISSYPGFETKLAPRLSA